MKDKPKEGYWGRVVATKKKRVKNLFNHSKKGGTKSSREQPTPYTRK